MKKFRNWFNGDIYSKLEQLEKKAVEADGRLAEYDLKNSAGMAALEQGVLIAINNLESIIDGKFDPINNIANALTSENESALRELADDIIMNSIDSDNKIIHIINRINDMNNAKQIAETKMSQVYELEQRFFQEVKEPYIELTPEQLKEINDFWERYSFCYKNNPNSQKYYYALSGKLDPAYVPWGLFRGYLYQFISNAGLYFFRDKNYLEVVFPNVKQPKTVIRKLGGYYYNSKRQVISENEAVDICYNFLSDSANEKLFVKPWEGGGGEGIVLIRKGFSKNKIKDIFGSYKETRFICQEAVTQHKSYVVPGIQSLNTLRIQTFNYNMKIHLVGLCYRMGGKADAEIDNTVAGGIAAKVNEDGCIDEYAMIYRNAKKYNSHPNGYEFAGRKLFNVEKAVEKAIELHYEVPMHRVLAWDFIIDEAGEPVMIEANGYSNNNFLQFFGFNIFLSTEICKKLLDDWILKKFYYDRANWEWNYREYYDHVEITRYAGLNSKVKIPEYIDGKKVTCIKKDAIKHLRIQEVIIPQSIKKENGAIADSVPSINII